MIKLPETSPVIVVDDSFDIDALRTAPGTHVYRHQSESDKWFEEVSETTTKGKYKRVQERLYIDPEGRASFLTRSQDDRKKNPEWSDWAELNTRAAQKIKQNLQETHDNTNAPFAPGVNPEDALAEMATPTASKEAD